MSGLSDDTLREIEAQNQYASPCPVCGGVAHCLIREGMCRAPRSNPTVTLLLAEVRRLREALAFGDAAIAQWKHNAEWADAQHTKAEAERDALREVAKALPLDKSFDDAADFKDNAAAFMRAMGLARALLSPVSGERPE